MHRADGVSYLLLRQTLQRLVSRCRVMGTLCNRHAIEASHQVMPEDCP